MLYLIVILFLECCIHLLLAQNAQVKLKMVVVGTHLLKQLAKETAKQLCSICVTTYKIQVN